MEKSLETVCCPFLMLGDIGGTLIMAAEFSGFLALFFLWFFFFLFGFIADALLYFFYYRCSLEYLYDLYEKRFLSLLDSVSSVSMSLLLNI